MTEDGPVLDGFDQFSFTHEDAVYEAPGEIPAKVLVQRGGGGQQDPPAI